MHRILHVLSTEQFASLDGAATVEEWLLRPLRRRAASRALRAAYEHTSNMNIAHVARLARLAALGVRVPDSDDTEAVAFAYAAQPIPTPRRAPVQTLVLLAFIALVLTGGAVFKHLTRPFDAAETKLGEALRARLGAHVAAVANGDRPTPDEALKRVFPRGGPSRVTQTMKELFAAELAAADAPHRMTDVFAKTRAVNAALSESGEPYYLDARSWKNKPLLYAFYKEREEEGHAEGFAPERIVFLWRLDQLNISKAALGYTHREAGAALVLYDQIEEFLIRDVLPALVEGETIELVDQASRDPKKAWQQDIEMRSARMVRESFATAADHEALVALGTLLARRRAIVVRWRADLASIGRVLREPARLLPEADYARDLWSLVPTATRHEWNEIHAALQSKEMVATFELLRDRFAADVARHELQHRFDAQQQADCEPESPCASIDLPPLVRKRVGPTDGSSASLGSMPSRVRNETSAYLAQMTPASSMPKMTILGMLRTVLDREAWGDVYCNTTIVVLDALADELGLHDESMPLVAGGVVQRASASSLAVLLFERSDDELRRAGASAWHTLYGRSVPAATMTLVAQGIRWRH